MGGSSMLCLIFNENTRCCYVSLRTLRNALSLVSGLFTLSSRFVPGAVRGAGRALVGSGDRQHASSVCRRAHPASDSPTRRNSLCVSHQPNAELPGGDERAVRGFELPAVAFAATERRGRLEGVRRRRGSLESVPRRGEPKAQSCDGTCCGRGAGHSRSGSPIRLQTGRA